LSVRRSAGGHALDIEPLRLPDDAVIVVEVGALDHEGLVFF
jgi:hypothetical protein